MLRAIRTCCGALLLFTVLQLPTARVDAFSAGPDATAQQPPSEAEKRRARQWDHAILRETFGYDENTPSDVDWNDVIQGCPKRDCIVSIDQPEFIAADAAGFLADDDLVLGVRIGNDARAYPRFVLDRREIVNDWFGDQAVAVTFCPLCGSGTAFSRVLGGQAVEFGVSGVLHDSDLVLYDRKSNSLWQQIGGRAFAGPMRGQTLQSIQVTMIEWSVWRTAHPDTRVLKVPDDGVDYSNRNPYQKYLESDSLMFPVRTPGGGMPVKTVVHGVTVAGRHVACADKDLRGNHPVEFTIDGATWKFERDSGGAVHVVSDDGAQRIPAQRMFWFAWYTFHTDTLLCSKVAKAPAASDLIPSP